VDSDVFRRGMLQVTDIVVDYVQNTDKYKVSTGKWIVFILTIRLLFRKQIWYGLWNFAAKDAGER
jgi:hypothetical protein